MAILFGIGSRGSVSLAQFVDTTGGGFQAYRLARLGSQHGIPAPEPERWWQTFGIFVQKPVSITGPQNTRAALAYLEEWLEQALDFHDPDSRERQSVWLHETADLEAPGDQSSTAGVRVALIYEYEIQPEASNELAMPLLIDNDELWIGTISIKRSAWETQDMITVPSPPTTLDVGGTWDLSPGGAPQAAGTLDGRISKLSFKVNTAAGSGDLYRMWFGIGEPYLGVYSNALSLNPGLTDVIPLDGGTNVYSIFDSALAENVAEIDFSGFGTSLAFALTRRALTPHFMAGKHLCLITARNTVASTVSRLRLSASFKSPGDTAGSGTYTYTFLDEEEITSTNWTVIDAGILELPPDERTTDILANLANTDLYLNLEVERLQGTGLLRLHNIFLIPAERRILIERAPVTAGVDTVEIFTTETGAVTVHITDASGNVEVPMVEAVNWMWPRNGGVLHFMGERETLFNDTDEIDNISLQWYPRWRSYRND